MKEYYTKGEICYIFGYLLWLISCVLGISHITAFLGIPNIVLVGGRYLSLCFLMLKFLEDEWYYKNKIFMIVAVLMVTLCVCYHNGQSGLLLWTMAFAFGMKGIDYYDILKMTVSVQGIIIAATIALAAIGWIENPPYGTIVWGSTMLGGDGHRYAMGYGHPNMASAVLFFWTIMYFVVKRRLTVWNVVFGIAVNYWLYTYTGSRTSFLLTLLVLPLMWCMDKYFSRIWQKLFLLAAAFLPVGNVLLQICYRPESTVYSIFNKLLSGRIGLGHDGFYNFGVPFFGQTIVWSSSGAEYNIVDNAYMYILVSFGIVFYLLIAVLCYFTMKRLICEGENRLCVAFLAWMLFGITEASILQIEFQPFCLLLGQMVGVKFDELSEKNKIAKSRGDFLCRS